MAYRLTGPDGKIDECKNPGKLGGNGEAHIYGKLDCLSAARALTAIDARDRLHRVFFASEEDAIAAGYRPCGTCMPEAYVTWKRGPKSGTPYRWQRQPKTRSG